MKVRIEKLKEIKNKFRNISFLMIGNNQSYDKVNANLKINNIIFSIFMIA